MTTSRCYTTGVPPKVISATEFKSKCLAILDEVNRNGGTVTITKRGRPVAVVGPAKEARGKTSLGAWVGKAELADNWENTDFSDRFEALRK